MDTSICRACKIEKSTLDYQFADRKTGRRSTQCKPCTSAYNKSLELKNKEKRQAQKEVYWAKNKTMLQPKRTEYMREKRASDEQFRIANNMRAILSRVVSGKAKKTSKDFGATLEQIRCHIEGLFKDGMSWENYGEWEIDHIKPVSSFDQTDLSQLNGCWHYLNIQPLWKQENRRKWAA